MHLGHLQKLAGVSFKIGFPDLDFPEICDYTSLKERQKLHRFVLSSQHKLGVVCFSIIAKRHRKFKKIQTFSFYDEKFAKNEIKQIKDLRKYIKNWNSDKNLVLVTHFVVISSIFNISPSSGEIIISDKNFNLIGRVNTY